MPTKDKDDDKKPAAKKDDETPVELSNPATAAHRASAPEPQDEPKDEKPALKPRAIAKAKAEDPPAPPPVPRRTIEELLADRSFDPEGLVRSRLAALSSKGGVGQMAPANLVDDQGMPIRQEA